MINKYDAAEIAKSTADTFRTRVSHHRVDITGAEYEAVIELCMSILADKVDNSQILDRQLNPATGEVTDGNK